jgi:hypothetical protein
LWVPPLMATNPEREARLAAALRANLKRRKAQARARAETAHAPPAPTSDGREGGEAGNPTRSGMEPPPRE